MLGLNTENSTRKGLPTMPPQPAHELQRLQAVHRRIVEMQLAGMRVTDIAQELGLSVVGVGRIVKSPLFQDELARRRQTQTGIVDEVLACTTARARESLDAAAASAVDTMVGLLGSESENVRLRSAAEILDRTVGQKDLGGGPKIIINALNLQALQIALQETRGGRDDNPPDGDDSTSDDDGGGERGTVVALQPVNG